MDQIKPFPRFPPTEAAVLPSAEQEDGMCDVPDRNFGRHQADEGSGCGGDRRGRAGLALSGWAAYLQGTALYQHQAKLLKNWSGVTANHPLCTDSTEVHRDNRQLY